MFGLSFSIVASGTPVFREIPDSVEVSVGHGVTEMYLGITGVGIAGAIFAIGGRATGVAGVGGAV
jgi:hypothetical protein